MITKLLATAVKLYLRSQVSQIHNLQVKITGENRQILKGYIPEVFLGCQEAVYQGLHLSWVEIYGSNIVFNLPEVLKQKPLKLLEPISVAIKLGLNGQDLQASLAGELLQNGLQDLWQRILFSEINSSVLREIFPSSLVWQEIRIASEQLKLMGEYQDALGQKQQITLLTQVSLVNSHTLSFSKLTIADSSSYLDYFIEQVGIDLGQDVAIQELAIAPAAIICRGNITVR